MQKRMNTPIALAISGIVAVGTTFTMDYIGDIKEELITANNQIKNLNKKNTEIIDGLNDELKASNKINLELEKVNDDLVDKVKSLEKELKEKEYPTKTRAIEQPKNRSIGQGTPVEITMTFYGDFAHENGGYAGIDCNSNKLVAGTVASNYYPQGTQFEFNGQIYTVRDRGGSNFNSANRLDVFVPRLKNESDSDYSKRIRYYGRKTVTMYKR